MKPAWWPWGKWTLFGMAASAAVMAMGSDDDPAPVVKDHAGLRKVSARLAPARDAARPDAMPDVAEIERLLQQKQAPDSNKEVGNAFNAVSWYVPPPPPPVQAVAPPAPTAPPLPFTYIGKYQEADAAHGVVFLAKADRVYTVAEGDVIEGTYSVGKVSGGQIEFTYLPLNINQLLAIGGA